MTLVFFFIVVVVLFNGYGGCEFYLFFGWMASTHSDFQSTHKFACLNKFLRLHNGIGVSASASVTKIDYMPLIDSFRFYVIFRYVHDTLHSLCCLWYWMFSESRDEENEPNEEKKICLCTNFFMFHLQKKKKKIERINYYYYYYHWMIEADRFQSHSEHPNIDIEIEIVPKNSMLLILFLFLSLVCFNFILDCCS